MNEIKYQKISSHEDIEQAKICFETAKLPWKELQKFFAAGDVFEIDQRFDLTEVALKMSEDNASYIQDLISKKSIERVSDQRAMQWIDSDALVWCVVVKPHILVQSINES